MKNKLKNHKELKKELSLKPQEFSEEEKLNAKRRYIIEEYFRVKDRTLKRQDVVLKRGLGKKTAEEMLQDGAAIEEEEYAMSAKEKKIVLKPQICPQQESAPHKYSLHDLTYSAPSNMVQAMMMTNLPEPINVPPSKREEILQTKGREFDKKLLELDIKQRDIQLSLAKIGGGFKNDITQRRATQCAYENL
eukprot:TRINITY_DN2695_c0_g1_i5.p1 TRINITY_DN2695_c0_g1~~TRINITY_DN2695_c0_g1_i5.p1  ORF type:complete len:191 (-),score=51.70 TRINITY_DN2695_c0_g1_i5:233-805(-)